MQDNVVSETKHMEQLQKHAQDVSGLVGAIGKIKEESDNNQDIARELEDEVGRFEKV